MRTDCRSSIPFVSDRDTELTFIMHIHEVCRACPPPSLQMMLQPAPASSAGSAEISCPSGAKPACSASHPLAPLHPHTLILPGGVPAGHHRRLLALLPQRPTRYATAAAACSQADRDAGEGMCVLHPSEWAPRCLAPTRLSRRQLPPHGRCP